MTEHNMQTPPFDTHYFEGLSVPFGDAENDYSCFQSLSGCYGIYVFQEKDTGEVLYVGEAHAQDLKKRITQNYTEKNTGGTFRKNWCTKENKDFNAFKTALCDWTIKIISIETDSKDLIRAIEAVFIYVLKPQYNK